MLEYKKLVKIAKNQENFKVARNDQRSDFTKVDNKYIIRHFLPNTTLILAHLLVFGSSKVWPNTLLKDLPKYHALLSTTLSICLMVFAKATERGQQSSTFLSIFGLFFLEFFG